MPKFSDYPVAPSYASDDYLLIDGASNKTRRMLITDVIGIGNKMKFEVIDDVNQATKIDTVYYTGDSLIFVVVQSTNNYTKSARQYRFSLLVPSIKYRSCTVANNVVVNAGNWIDFYDDYREGLEGYEEINGVSEATQNGIIYKLASGEICFVLKGTSSARQYRFDFATGSICTRTASVNNGDMYDFSDWVDIVGDAVGNKMGLITSDISVPYDYENDRPNTSSQVFASIPIGQVFVSEFYDGAENINTYWRKTSASTCEPLVGKMNSDGEAEYYSKEESDAKYATQATANVKMFLPNNTTQMDVPANLEGTGPNTGGSDFAKLSIGQIFRCVLNGKTTYWIKQSASVCKRIDCDDVYSKDEVDELLSGYYTQEEIDALFDNPELDGYRIDFVDYAPPSSTRTNKNGSRPTLDENWIWFDVENCNIYKCTSATLTSSDNTFNYYDLTWSDFTSIRTITNDAGLSSIPNYHIFRYNQEYYVRDTSAPQIGAQTKLARYSDITNVLGNIETLLSQV